jgi:manganese transport protein
VGVAVLIAGLNGKLVLDSLHDMAIGGGWFIALALPVALALGGLLLYLGLAPWLQRRWPRLAPAPPPAVQAMGSRSVHVAHTGVVAGPAGPPAFQAGAYRRIAVALEMGGSDGTVLEFLRKLTFAPGAELVLLHVVESAASRYLGEQSLDEESREEQATLEALADEFRARGVTARAVLGHGDAKHEIARVVRAEAAELLVTGSHGHTGLRDVVYGTTVSAVRHLVECPVLTVPPPR